MTDIYLSLRFCGPGCSERYGRFAHFEAERRLPSDLVESSAEACGGSGVTRSESSAQRPLTTQESVLTTWFNRVVNSMSGQESDTKQRILAAAEAEFLARGYDRSRMQAIADRAQINKAMLHYHFRSKDELFAQIFRNKAGILFPKVEASLRQEPDFIRFTCSFIDLYIAHLIEHPFLPSYLIQVSTNHVELLEQVKIDFPKRFVAAFEAAKTRKSIRPHDAKQFVVSLLGMCVMPFVGKNLVKGFLGLDEREYDALLAERAEEIKRYVVLLLTPARRRKKEV